LAPESPVFVGYSFLLHPPLAALAVDTKPMVPTSLPVGWLVKKPNMTLAWPAMFLGCLAAISSASRVVLGNRVTEADEAGTGTPSCENDIIVTTNGGIARVLAHKVRAEDVPLFWKYATFKGQPCMKSYLAACDKDDLNLVILDNCSVGGNINREVRSLFGGSLFGGGIKRAVMGRPRRTEVHPNKGEIKISFNPQFHLPDIAQGGVLVDHDGVTCGTGKNAQCGRGCGFLGQMCIPLYWAEKDNCPQETQLWPAVTRDCRSLIFQAMSVAQDWLLIITSSGGGGHIAAAKNLRERYSASWGVSADLTKAQVATKQDILTEVGFQRVTQAIIDATADPPVEVVNLMKSECTNLLGELGVPMGKGMTQKWDSAQRRGDLQALRNMIRQQWLVDPVFGTQCKNFLRRVLEGTVLPRFGPPTSLISTQPLLLKSLAAVAKEDEQVVDLFMTDLPTELAVHFFEPLKAMASSKPELAKLVRLHTVAPAGNYSSETGKQKAKQVVAEASGLAAQQVIIEPFMPVSKEFMDGGGLPKPGEATKITLRAQIQREQQFLGGQTKDFKIAAKDTLVLVMLGSQPTIPAMRSYLSASLYLGNTAPDGVACTGKYWVFLACGQPNVIEYRGLYEDIVKTAEQVNAESERLRIVPFSGQPAAQIEGRADATVTRTGGMTSGELLALGARGDKRHVLLHIEVPIGASDVAPKEQQRYAVWESSVLGRGMVPWEAGNARYLMKQLGARLVTPAMFAAALEPAQDL